MKEIFNLTKYTLINSKTWIIIFAVLSTLPWLIPFLAPTEEERSLYMPALAQGAWQTLWWIGSIFLITTSATIGKHFARDGVFDYFSAKKVGKKKFLVGATFPIIIFGIIMGIIPLLICGFGATPSNPDEYDVWWVMQIQAYSLWIITLPLLITLPFALSFRLSSAVATIIASCGLYFCMEALSFIDMMRRNVMQDPLLLNFFEFIWTVVPHIHLADLSERMIFKMGELPTKAWIFNILYFTGYCFVAYIASTLVLPTQGPGKKEKAKKHIG